MADPFGLLIVEAYNNTVKLALAIWEAATPEQRVRMIEPNIKRNEWWDRVFAKWGDAIMPPDAPKP